MPIVTRYLQYEQGFLDGRGFTASSQASRFRFASFDHFNEAGIDLPLSLHPSGPTPSIRLSRFIFLAFVSHVALAVPFMGIVWATGGPVDVLLGGIVGPLLILGAPLVGALSWLVAKGSNWTNTIMAAAFAAGYSMPVYVPLASTFIGAKVGSGAPWWLLAAMLVIVAFARMALFRQSAKAVLRWLAPELLNEPGKHIV